MWGRQNASTMDLQNIRLCCLQKLMGIRTEMLPLPNLAATSHSHSAAFLLPPQIWVCEFTPRFWRFQIRGCIHDKILAASKYQCDFRIKLRCLQISLSILTEISPPRNLNAKHHVRFASKSPFDFALNFTASKCHRELTLRLRQPQIEILPQSNLNATPDCDFAVYQSHCAFTLRCRRVHITVEVTMSCRCL